MNIITEWGGGLDLALQIFYALGIFSGSVLLLQTLLMLLGIGDGDVDLDTDVGLDAGDGMHILSVRTITAFLFGFGWTGAICLKSDLNILLTLLIATGAGTAMLLIILAIMRLFHGLRQDGTLNYRNAIGEIGSVYLPIPAGGKTPGQIEVMVQGRLKVVQAYTQGDQAIPTRAKVNVVRVLDQQSLLVEPLT